MNIKDNMLKFENNLATYATKDIDAIRLKDEKSTDIRPNYFHDIDRIIHSLSYTRYIDKTQVYANQSNDNISKRIIHVQLVSKIARTIGRALSLNEDLIEAIALGHDIGHVPFGHLGESYLNELSLEYDHTYFMHNVESVRCLMVLESNGIGKNLTIQTLDGILCHNGEFIQNKYKPKRKTKEDFLNDYNNCYTTDKYYKKLIPMTLEGCVVRISDIIGYLGRDIEDAIRLKKFSKDQLPESISNILGSSNKDIVNTIILDIINNSMGKDYITMSEDVYKAIKDLKEFNYKNIYDKSMTDDEKKILKIQFRSVFENNLKNLENKDKNASIYKVFLKNMSNEYLENTSNTRKVIDYIAGMTDEYFLTEYKNIHN